MDRKAFLDALAALPDEQLEHVAAVTLDIAKRLPEHAFDGVQTALANHDPQTIEWEPPVPALPEGHIELTGPDGEKYVVVRKVRPSDVIVELSGEHSVTGQGELNGGGQ